MSFEPLRELACTVREHSPSAYYWILLERSDAGEWEAITVSKDYLLTWVDAFDAGVVFLCMQVSNELIGPRQGG